MRKFKCVGYKQNHEKNFTVGKIYYGEDGSGIKCDNGFIYDCYKSIDEVIDFLNGYYEFEEVFDEEVKEDKKVSKFKVGDVVEIIGNESGHCFNIGDIVELYEDCDGDFRGRTSKNETYGNHIEYSDMKLDRDYMIGELNEYCSEYNCDDCVFKGECDEFDAMIDEELFEAYSLAFGNDQSTSKTFTITTSNTTTTLTDGTHTTSINRYYTDKHDDMIALEEVVKKYKSEMEEIEHADKMPKVDDKVKVIDDRYYYTTYYQWFFENKITDECAMKWRYNFYPKNSERVFRVVAIGKHNRDNVVIALITDDYNTYLINIEGLEVIK